MDFFRDYPGIYSLLYTSTRHKNVRRRRRRYVRRIRFLFDPMEFSCIREMDVRNALMHQYALRRRRCEKKITSGDFYQFLHVLANPIADGTQSSHRGCEVNPATSEAAKICGSVVFISTDFREKNKTRS